MGGDVPPRRTNCAGGVSGDCGFGGSWPCFLGTPEVRAAGSSALPDQASPQAEEEGAPHSQQQGWR